MKAKLWGGVAFFAVIVAFVIYGVSWNRTLLTSAGLNLDLGAPDALIRSKSLSSLPADLLSVPLLRDLLSEDFLFYYENSESRLGLSGTLRRIAYEHEVTLADELIKLVMDEPADVALWRGSRGELKYYAIAMSRGKLAKLLEPVAKIALKDKQLNMVGELRVAGDKVQIYALEYAWNRKMLLTSHEDRVVIFSDPAMLLSTSGELSATAEGMLKDLLGPDKNNQQRFVRAFDLDTASSDHSIAVKTNFLSFSYQHFFPALKAVRFDFSEKPLSGGQNWSAALLLDAAPPVAASILDARTLWASLPYQPGACVTLPVDWRAVVRTMNSQKVASMAEEQLAAQFEGPVAACWYAKSRLHTPLFVAQLSKEEGADSLLSAYYNYGIKQQQITQGKNAGAAKPVTNKAGDVVWQFKQGSDKTLTTLARSGKLVYFSPDASLVEQALAVARKRQPALSDSWKDQAAAGNTVAVFGPPQLAQIAEQEVLASLPQQQDAVLRLAAEQHLMPKLAAVKKYPAMRLQMREAPQGAGWIALDWK